MCFHLDQDDVWASSQNPFGLSLATNDIEYKNPSSLLIRPSTPHNKWRTFTTILYTISTRTLSYWKFYMRFFNFCNIRACICFTCLISGTTRVKIMRQRTAIGSAVNKATKGFITYRKMKDKCHGTRKTSLESGIGKIYADFQKKSEYPFGPVSVLQVPKGRMTIRPSKWNKKNQEGERRLINWDTRITEEKMKGEY